MRSSIGWLGSLPSASSIQSIARGNDPTGLSFSQERGTTRLNMHHTWSNGLARSRGGSARSLAIVGREWSVDSGQWSVSTRWGQAMKLHSQVAHTGSSGSMDFAGSPDGRGWRSGKIKADRTAENVKYRKTKPTQPNRDCHKSYCGIALNSFGASVGSKSKATVRGCFLFAAGCLDRDCRTGSRESSGRRARQPKLRIGQNKATGSQPRLLFNLLSDNELHHEK